LLSSFQLDGIIVDYKPHIAIITNISPDHLDDTIINMKTLIPKFRIMNQTEEDYLMMQMMKPLPTG
jgi:UDP-N-acetylmuramoylalanine--D-glutamate ligase